MRGRRGRRSPLRFLSFHAFALSAGRIYDDVDMGAKPVLTRPAVAKFLRSTLNSSRGREENDFAAHHRLAREHCMSLEEGCTWEDYNALLRELHRPWRDMKDPGAHVLPLKPLFEEVGETCDRLHRPSAKRFLRQVASSRPAVITGVASKWPAVKKWSWAFLLDHLAGVDVKVSVNPTPFFDGPDLAASWNLTGYEYVLARPGLLEVSFQQFAGLLRSRYAKDAQFYLQYFPASELGDLKQDLGALSFAQFLQHRFHLIWFGDGRTGGHTHYDSEENLMAMLRGSKTFTLADPSQSKWLYANETMPQVRFQYGFDKHEEAHFVRDLRTIDPVTLGHTVLQNKYSPVPLQNADVERWPLFKRAKTVVCEVKEGEILYNPGHWWHHVQSEPDAEGKNIGVNIFAEGMYNRYNAMDPYFLANRYYSHIYDFGMPKRNGFPTVRVSGKSNSKVRFISRDGTEL